MLKKLKFLFSVLESSEKRIFFAYLFFSVISPALDIFSFAMLLQILNRIISGSSITDAQIYLVAGMTVVSASKALIDLYKSKLTNRFLYSSAQSISFKIFELFAHEELSEHYKKSPAQAVEIVRQDSFQCVAVLADFVSIITQSCTLAAYAVVLIAETGWIGVVSIALLVLWMLVRFQKMRERIKRYGELCRDYQVQANASVTTAFGAYKELRIDQRASYLQKRFEEVSRKYAKAQSDFSFLQNLCLVLMRDSIITAVYLLLLLVLLLQFNLGTLLPYLVIYITLMMKLEPISYGIISGLNRIEFSNKPFEVIRENYQRYLEYRSQKNLNIQRRKVRLTFHRGLSVRGLTFAYDGKKPLFLDADIDIPAGKSVAIIGASGSGKTTFLDLILGLLKPQSGYICYDDFDVVSSRDTEGECTAFLGEIVSYIPQTVYLNGETIRNNVAFMEEYSQINEARVIECLKAAQIWEDIQEMPRGIDTIIGDSGVPISGGQRQRVALARALYKEFELLILDEATAALDAATEREVMDAIRKLKGNKTIILVTHHMGLVDQCDAVYKIQNQKFVQVR